MTERIEVKSPETEPGLEGKNVDGVKGDGSKVTAEPSSTPTPESKPADGQRPDWLPEKFNTPEDMAKAYGELEKKQSRPDPKPDPEPEEKKTLTADDAKITERKAEEAGVDFDAISDEFIKNDGKLSDKTYEDLDKRGFGREQVDRYIEGQKALSAQVTTELAESVGGKESLDAVLAWARDNLTPAEIEAYNATLDRNDTASAKLLLTGINARYTSAVGADPNLVTGGNTPRTTGAQPFASNAEMIKAIGDERYSEDPAYRKSVEQRIAVTNF